MPVKKSTRSKASATSKKRAAASRTNSKKSKPTFNAGTMLVAAMCVAGAVIVIAAHEMTPAPRVASSETQPADISSAAVEPKPTATTMRADDSAGTTAATDTTETSTSTASTAPVTIFGCLEHSNDTYRLTDTDGVDAPRARSWKTAFLKKGSASVEIVDPGNRAHLSSQIGHRVGVTGTLSDRQLQVRSIRKISSSCGN
jgi:cytoskeletal protein RodZ